jgi:hypothetical protein
MENPTPLDHLNGSFHGKTHTPISIAISLCETLPDHLHDVASYTTIETVVRLMGEIQPQMAARMDLKCGKLSSPWLCLAPRAYVVWNQINPQKDRTEQYPIVENSGQF